VIAKFLRGKISEKEFFRKDPPPRGVPAHSWAVRRPGTQSSEAWFFAGLKRVVDGDKKNAAEYFRKCSTAPGKYELERELAEAELKAIRAK
jgi:hypothetical protein